MLYAQMKHPVTLATLLFLLIAGSAVRWNEYSLPRYARSVNMTAVDLAKRPKTAVSAELTAAVRLYEEASQLLNGYEEESTEYTPVVRIARRYFGNPPQNIWGGADTLPKTFFSEIRPDLEAYLNQRQDVLALLYRAAELPTSSSVVLRNPKLRWSSSRSQDHAIVKLLLLDALRHAIDHDEAGALRAITGLDAFIRAQERLNPLTERGRQMLGFWLSGLVLGYGIEASVFNDESLDILEKVFTYEEDPGGRVIRRHLLSNINKIFHNKEYKVRNYFLPGLGMGVSWYKFRYSCRNIMKQLMLYELLLKCLPGAALWDENGRLADTVQRVFETTHFIYPDDFLVDPYNSDESVNSIYCYYNEFFVTLSTEYHGVQERVALRTAIALERYRRRCGDFPYSLDELTARDITPNLLRMARNMIDYRKMQRRWELLGKPDDPGRKMHDWSVLLYRYPLLTPEE